MATTLLTLGPGLVTLEGSWFGVGGEHEVNEIWISSAYAVFLPEE